MEDALKKLDILTQEEARMAVAQILKVTHAIDEGVRRAADTVITMDNRVAGASSLNLSLLSLRLMVTCS
jgi:hypothetical protein